MPVASRTEAEVSFLRDKRTPWNGAKRNRRCAHTFYCHTGRYSFYHRRNTGPCSVLSSLLTYVRTQHSCEFRAFNFSLTGQHFRTFPDGRGKALQSDSLIKFQVNSKREALKPFSWVERCIAGYNRFNGFT